MGFPVDECAAWRLADQSATLFDCKQPACRCQVNPTVELRGGFASSIGSASTSGDGSFFFLILKAVSPVWPHTLAFPFSLLVTRCCDKSPPRFHSGSLRMATVGRLLRRSGPDPRKLSTLYRCHPFQAANTSSRLEVKPSFANLLSPPGNTKSRCRNFTTAESC